MDRIRKLIEREDYKIHMSYCRSPYYIYSDGQNMNFDFIGVPEDMINVFLYKILLTNRRDELFQRVMRGRRILFEVSDKEYIAWMKEREDIF